MYMTLIQSADSDGVICSRFFNKEIDIEIKCLHLSNQKRKCRSMNKCRQRFSVHQSVTMEVSPTLGSLPNCIYRNFYLLLAV